MDNMQPKIQAHRVGDGLVYELLIPESQKWIEVAVARTLTDPLDPFVNVIRTLRYSELKELLRQIKVSVEATKHDLQAKQQPHQKTDRL